MSLEDFPKKYSHQDEPQIYEEWEKAGLFDPDKSLEAFKNQGGEPTGKRFMIPMPPPNVTGVLHLGHAMMLAIEDALVRYHRMMGDKTLWIPGTDHA